MREYLRHYDVNHGFLFLFAKILTGDSGKMFQIKRMPAYHDVDGFRIPQSMSPNCLRGTIRYEPKDDDIFIVTFPKCGTTWTQHIVYNILNKGEEIKNFKEFNIRCPFMEFLGPQSAEDMPRPGAIKTHLPFHLNPYSPKAKYIYVARNPKDCCVSFYHHTKMLTEYQFTDGTFEDFFEIFLNGKTDFGDYFDTLLSWYKHRNDPNVLFLTYENMKSDTRGTVFKIAEFLGAGYASMLNSDETLVKKILYQTSAEYMMKNVNEQIQEFVNNEHDDQEDVPEGIKYCNEYIKKNNIKPMDDIQFVRKAVVGDWKNHFTPAQSRRLMEKFKERTRETDIPLLWPGLFSDVEIQ
ncbi:sulfotransferase 1C2-like isoform X1 [Tachypleus tridentatus]|uniref:sulfotransferase 1C2-like isoform X1 n=2 Tax=Tachypleus tridentatus TaxID=6853 RepID=UPI003FD681A2